MENLNYYLDQLKNISSLFNTNITSDHGDLVKFGNKFVFQLVLELCSNTILQQQVLTKLKEYTSHITNYLTGIHLKPKYFEDIIQKYHKFIIIFLTSCKINKQPLTTGYVIDFIFDNNKKHTQPSTMNAYQFTTSQTIVFYYIDNQAIVDVDPLFEHETIFMESIVGNKTIEKYGIDGFLALLIIFINEDNILLKYNVDSLFVLCQKNLAKKFNSMCSNLDYLFYDECNLPFGINHRNLSGMIKPKEFIKKWINFLEPMLSLPNALVVDSIKYINKRIQMVFFKEIRTKNDKQISNFITDYDNIIDRLVLDYPHDKELFENVRIIFKLKELKDWHEYLQKLILMDNSFIIKVLFSIDKDFSYVLLNVNIDNCFVDLFTLKIKTRKIYVPIKGNLYPSITQIDDIDDIKTTTVNWHYDKNLNVSGYDLTEYLHSDGSEIIRSYDADDNLLLVRKGMTVANNLILCQDMYSTWKENYLLWKDFLL
ncbi:putative ORFan [Tupanvirus deep ocean]|uniref:ORFan n=2 Tax=Tupanvirus TaxID=2094720 RepID=A0AC62A7T2_9VIRU|nr:putative ORFan [Tupanvirus deep ocean]QKU33717.1 putative ORFan [Tupanvirus deep ocean]